MIAPPSSRFRGKSFHYKQSLRKQIDELNYYGQNRRADMSKFPKIDQFEEWCKAPPEYPDQAVVSLERIFNDGRHGNLTPDEWRHIFQTETNTGVRKGINHLIIKDVANVKNFEIDFPVAERFSPDGQIFTNVDLVTINEFKKITISGLNIKEIKIRVGVKNLMLKECCIGRVHADHDDLSLNIENCQIGRLDLAKVKHVNAVGGTIRSFISRPPNSNEKSIFGSASFSNVEVPTSKSQSKFFNSSQQLTNLRAQLESLQNVQHSVRFRHLELRAERENDEGFTRFANWLFDIVSRHGSAPARPLGWLLALLMIMIVGTFTFDGAVRGLADDCDYLGWRQVLIGSDRFAALSRSALLALQTIFNPLGILGHRVLVVASTGWVQVPLAAAGLLADFCIVMAILAIRRRFKIS